MSSSEAASRNSANTSNSIPSNEWNRKHWCEPEAGELSYETISGSGGLFDGLRAKLQIDNLGRGEPTIREQRQHRNSAARRRVIFAKAGMRVDLPEGERKRVFAGHSLCAGLASSPQVEEAHVQKHHGHASAEMTRRYQRKRDRFRVNLTKTAGL
jgi:hypothetical protein